MGGVGGCCPRINTCSQLYLYRSHVEHAHGQPSICVCVFGDCVEAGCVCSTGGEW